MNRDWPQNDKPPQTSPVLGQSLYSIAIPHQQAPRSEHPRVSSTIQYSRAVPGGGPPPLVPPQHAQYVPNTVCGPSTSTVGPGGPSLRLSPGQYAPTTYTSLQGFEPNGAANTERFYGTLIDAYGRPSEVMCRLADALFFYMDQRSDVHRNTGFIEPAKYGWLMKTIGVDVITAAVCEQLLLSLYIEASVPYGFQNVQGAAVPVLDRRGWLHFAVFDARALPGESHMDWYRILDTLKLCDPSNNEPFPTPILRSAFPAVQDAVLCQVYRTWQAQIVVATQEIAKASTLRYANMAQHIAVTGSISLGTGSQGDILGPGNQALCYQQANIPGLQNIAGMTTGQHQNEQEAMRKLGDVVQSTADIVYRQSQNAQDLMMQGINIATAQSTAGLPDTQPENPLIAVMEIGAAILQSVLS